MERIMSVEDKIRRAEEIYNRRRQYEYKEKNARVTISNKKETSNKSINKRLRKMIIQIIVCMLIYLMFHYINRGDYIFSADVINKCEEILSYDISFNKMYQDIVEAVTQMQSSYQNSLNNINEKKTEEEQNNSNIQEENDKEQEIPNEERQQEDAETRIEEPQGEPEIQIPEDEQTNLDESIGGPEEQVIDEKQEEQLTEEEQMKEDAEEIKGKISFIKPLEGIITSTFGWRNPTVSTVSKYHTGIDIGANEGTDIISATNGIVQLASSEGAYGNHLKIVVDGVEIIYAHCLTLEVQEGEEIIQGQLIAKVGNTGNSTGPHLHFEIRKEGRYIDPDLILDF